MITLKNGDTLVFDINFKHIGEAAQAIFHAAIGKKAVIGGFDEKQFAEVTVATNPDDIVQSYHTTVSIVIANVGTTLYPAGADYEAYVKLMKPGFPPTDDLFFFFPDNDITLQSLLASQFSNLVVTYAKG